MLLIAFTWISRTTSGSVQKPEVLMFTFQMQPVSNIIIKILQTKMNFSLTQFFLLLRIEKDSSGQELCKVELQPSIVQQIHIKILATELPPLFQEQKTTAYFLFLKIRMV